MECITCGLRSGFNRIVIRTDDDRAIGFFCRRCEKKKFGTVLREGQRAETEGCVLCSRDSYVFLPVWSPRIEDDVEGGLVLTNGYEITSHTTALCDEHFSGLETQGSLSLPKTEGTHAER